jgi:hypothetical protein
MNARLQLIRFQIPKNTVTIHQTIHINKKIA